jgi:hypothetical protein
MEKFNPAKEHGEEAVNPPYLDRLENRGKRRAIYKRITPLALGVASLFGGEHQAMSQTHPSERESQRIELSREFTDSTFGFYEIVEAGFRIQSKYYPKEKGEALRKQLVAKYGEAAVEFGFQFDAEDNQLARADAEKEALRIKTDAASQERMVALDAEQIPLGKTHWAKSLALESVLEALPENRSMGTHHYSMGADHLNGAPLSGEQGRYTKTEWTEQVSYEKYQAPVGESESASAKQMERVLEDYLLKQGMDRKKIETQDAIRYFVRDPASPPERPVYLLVEGFVEKPGR